MLIQRTPSCSMTSTCGSACAGATGALARAERRRRGRGRLGIASEGVVLHRRGHLFDSTSTAGWPDLRPFSRGQIAGRVRRRLRLAPSGEGTRRQGVTLGGTARIRRGLLVLAATGAVAYPAAPAQAAEQH